MRRTGKSETCVWRWQERFMEEGFDGLLRDKTRPSSAKPLGSEVSERIVSMMFDPTRRVNALDGDDDGEGRWRLRQLPSALLARS